MRAMSWYQSKQEEQMENETYDPGCTGLPYHSPSRSQPKPTLPCVSFVPAHHRVTSGVLFQKDGVNPQVSVSEVYGPSLSLLVTHPSFSPQHGGTWTKE